MKSLLEEEHAVLKDRLSRNLKRKHALELEINRQYEKLKKLEIRWKNAPPFQHLRKGQSRLSCFVYELSRALNLCEWT